MNEKRMQGRTVPVTSIVIMVTATVCAFFVLIFLLWKAGLFALPAFLENWLEKEDAAPLQKTFHDEFILSLKEEPSSEDAAETYIYRKIDVQTAKDLLDAARVPDKYAAEFTVEVYSENDIYALRNASIWVSGNRFAAELSESRSLVRRSICDGMRMSVRDAKGNVTLFPYEESLSVYDEAGLPNVAYALAKISEGGEEYAIDCEISENRKDAVVQITFTYMDTGIREVWVIETETLIPVSVSSYLAEAEFPYYSVNRRSIQYEYETAGIFIVERGL